jgi:hypothetical protein
MIQHGQSVGFFKQLAYLLLIELIFLILYFAALYGFTTIVKSVLLFPVSVIIISVEFFLIWYIINKYFKPIFDNFTTFLISLCCAVTVLLFAVFGPVFIDRSISYQLVFYAVEEGQVNYRDFVKKSAAHVYSKRLSDAIASGFVEEVSPHVIRPTPKAHNFYSLMMTVGNLTNSLQDYQTLKASVHKAEQ